jgi:GNAT superfamily N-acetyltransferase
MFVETPHRNRGLGRQILSALEKRAGALGYRRIRLETGDRQPEAIALYSSAGYERIPAYGEFAASQRSLCFEKSLS